MPEPEKPPGLQRNARSAGYAVRKTERPFARQAEDEVVAVKLVIICFYLFFLSVSGVKLYLFFVFAKFIAENFLFVAIF